MTMSLSVKLSIVVAVVAAMAVSTAVWVGLQRGDDSIAAIEQLVLQRLDENFSSEEAEIAVELEQKAQRLANFIAVAAPASVIAFNVDALETFGAAALEDPDIAYVAVVLDGDVALMETGDRSQVGSSDLKRADVLANGETLAEIHVGFTGGRVEATRDRLAAAKASEAADLDAFAERQRAEATETGMIVLLKAVGLASVLIYVVVHVLIGAPLRRMSTTMTQLADGDHSVAIPSRRRSDEVGRIADALEIFRTNAQEIEEMRESRERMAAEAAAQAEARQRAREDQIGGEIAAAAKALADGDLEARIDLVGKEGVFAKICESSNNLAEELGLVTRDVASAMRALADGRIDHRINLDRSGAFGDLAEDVDRAFQKLREVISEIQSASTATRTAAEEISRSADGVAHRAESQTTDLDMTATAVRAFSQSSKSNADAATDAAGRATEARSQTSNGAEIVLQAVGAVERIEQSSSRISDIVSMIEAISFQTNLLALNAAVEAARAGDAGNGFAVVAQEVRVLAQRSSDAAKDISDLIGESAGNVAEGAGLVRETGDALSSIRDGMKSLAASIDAISSTAQEQFHGVGEVDLAIRNIAENTHQNRSAAERTAETGRSLLSCVERLERLVEAFGGTSPAHGAKSETRLVPSSSSAA